MNRDSNPSPAPSFTTLNLAKATSFFILVVKYHTILDDRALANGKPPYDNLKHVAAHSASHPLQPIPAHVIKTHPQSHRPFPPPTSAAKPHHTTTQHNTLFHSYTHKHIPMSLSLSSLPFLSPPPTSPHAHVSPTLPPMSILRRLTQTLTLAHPHRLRRLSSIAAAFRQDTTVWTPAPVSIIEPAAESLFHITVDLSDSPDLASSHARAGQYLQLRVADNPKPSFLAIASPPKVASARGVFEFLVKSVPGSTAEILCGLKKGTVVELSQVLGNGFDISRIDPPGKFGTVFIFATGSGISPIRSLIESGFSAAERSDVRLYYGARNLQRMAYQDRFKDWESSGVKIVPVLSQPDGSWNGESGYVQAAFTRTKQITNPLSTGAVLCGQKEMTEEVTSILTADGVSSDKILKNF